MGLDNEYTLMQEQQFGCVARSVGDWTVLKSGRYV